MLELIDLRKSYPNATVLDSINLTVPQGHTHAIMGPSGAGKTTLLRVTLGLTPFDQGYVKIEGNMLLSYSPTAWAEKVGYVPQEAGLFPHLNARQNVTLVARVRHWERSRVEARLKELCALVELELASLERFPSELSGGQRQRVAIMRAAFLNPSVLLLDEPLGALDPILRRDLQKELKSIFQRLKKTVILVTHDLGEAAFLAEQISLMRDGRILQTGTFDELVHKPTDPFVTFFINAQRDLGMKEEAR